MAASPTDAASARWRTLAALAGATGLSQAIVIVASPVLTRIYVPADFGVYGAAVSIVALIVGVACLRYEQAIPLPKDAETVASLVVLCLVLAALVTTVAGIVLLLASDDITSAFGAAFKHLLAPILLAVLGGAVYLILSIWAIRVSAFGDIARTRVTQAVGLVALQVGMGIAGAGPTGLVLGDAVGRSGGTMRLATLMWRAEGPALRRVGPRTIWAAARKYRRFALLSTPSALLDVLAIQAPTLILLSLFGTTVAGWYLLALRVGTVPNSLAAASVGPVYLAESARDNRDNPSALSSGFTAAVKRLALVGAVPTLLLLVGSPMLFPFVFGPAWANAGLYVAILSPMLFAQLVTSPVSGILGVLERQDLHLARELASIAVLGTALLISIVGRFEATAVVTMLSIAGTLNALVYLGVMRVAIARADRARRC